MPITISYDLANANGSQRNHIRSMFERFGWQRLGGSVFRYVGKESQEDWLNEVVPSIMFFRSYISKHRITLRYFTLDTNSVTRIDNSDPALPVGRTPVDGAGLDLHPPTNTQSSVKRLRRSVQVAIDVLSSARKSPTP